MTVNMARMQKYTVITIVITSWLWRHPRARRPTGTSSPRTIVGPFRGAAAYPLHPRLNYSSVYRKGHCSSPLNLSADAAAWTGAVHIRLFPVAKQDEITSIVKLLVMQPRDPTMVGLVVPKMCQFQTFIQWRSTQPKPVQRRLRYNSYKSCR